MNKTNIEWVRNPDGSQGYTWNPITGCLNNENGLCKGGGFPCYACKLAKGRLKQRYLANHNLPFPIIGDKGYAEALLNPFYPRFWEERLKQPYKRLENSGIFVCDMGDLYAPWIPKEWGHRVFEVIVDNPWHRFYTLTKQSQELIKFSPFPENCWVGVTATNTEMFLQACTRLEYPVRAKVKYISVEPLLNWEYHFTQGYLVNCLKRAEINWLIIGACTGNLPDMTLLAEKYPDLWLARDGNKITAQPRIEWVQEIVEAADQTGIPVFLKDNLSPLLGQLTIDDKWAWAQDIGYGGLYRQELPNMTLVRSKW